MMRTRTVIRMMMKLVFGREKRGKSASERAEAARSRDSILAASISYLPPYQWMLPWIERASKKYVSVESA